MREFRIVNTKEGYLLQSRSPIFGIKRWKGAWKSYVRRVAFVGWSYPAHFKTVGDLLSRARHVLPAGLEVPILEKAA